MNWEETWPASQSNKIDTLSIHGLGDGFSLQVIAGDTVMVTGGGGGGGTLDFKWQGSDQLGTKIKTQKHSWTKFNPQKFPESIKWYNYHKSSNCFEYHQKTYLNQATKKKIHAKIFLPKKSFEIGSTPTPHTTWGYDHS